MYSIGAVAQMLEMPASTLRAWEERYKLLAPARSENGQRLYSRVQLEQLRFIKQQIESGMSAADAHRALADQLQGDEPPLLPSDPDEPRPLILIAERDGYAAKLVEYFLRTEGYGVAVALNGLQARLQFEERAPDVVVLDLLISGGAGFRLCRQFSTGDRARVLAVSALDSADEAVMSGASAFLMKPVEPLELVATVRDLLKTSAVTRPTSQAVLKP